MNYRLLVAVVLAGMLAACAARPAVMGPPLDPAASIVTLNSSIALSVTAGEKGISGRGYLLMRSPDQFRLVLVSPFGTTVAEMFLLGDELLYLDASRKLAYQGLVADLPDAPALQGLRLLRWTAERVLPEVAGQEYIRRQRAGGEWEYVDFDARGLVTKKSIGGDQVRYEGYQSVDGVPVPTAIEIMDQSGIVVRMTLDEPEVNKPLAEKAFVPVLEGVTILPLRQFPTS